MIREEAKIIGFFIIALTLLTILYVLITPSTPPQTFNTRTTTISPTVSPYTTTTVSTTTSSTTTNTAPATRTNQALLEAEKIIEKYLLEKNFMEALNNTYTKNLIISAEWYWRVQKLYAMFGGHGLVPLRSLSPSEILYYFSPYSLEVSEYACEIPYLYAWIYWITHNTTWLERTRFSVDAIRYWSIDYVPLGGCWGSTDPIVYDKYTSRYRVRWYLLTWYAQTQLSWWNTTWFKKSIINAWNYTYWHDPVYNWTWFTPWELVHYGPPRIQEEFKQAYMDFTHYWIKHRWFLDKPPYAYIFNGSSWRPVSGSKIHGDTLIFSYTPLTARTGEAVLKTPVQLSGNAAYAVLLNLDNKGYRATIQVILTSKNHKITLSFPQLPRGDNLNVTMGEFFLLPGQGGNYTLDIRVTPYTGISVNLIVKAIGLLALPSMRMSSLYQSYGFWGDGIGPLSLALIHYYPSMKPLIVKSVIAAIKEMIELHTDKIYYPPDPRWRFMYWNPSENAIAWTRSPAGTINYASLEETLESFIPLVILTGDKNLLITLADAAKLLNHNNYWKGLGYWSAWFGIWTHLWLFAATGDTWYWEQAQYYIGTMNPFQQSLKEEVSNAAKFIEANIVAYDITGDKTYIDLARKMALVLLREFVDHKYGFIKPYRNEQALARHDMLAWTASPLLSLYLNIWVPDWMLWLYPVAIDDHGRPNGYFTPINITYAPDAIIIWDTKQTMLYLEKTSNYIIVPKGLKAMNETDQLSFPYQSRIVIEDTDKSIALVGFNGTGGYVTTLYTNNENTLIISSSTPRVWIIKINPAYIGSVNIIIDGQEGAKNKDYIVIGSYILIKPSDSVEITIKNKT